jgi:predicted DNA-binding transcriptional regulator
MDNQEEIRDNNSPINIYQRENTGLSLNDSFFPLINKKTEKLVTALYMVTDCMDEGDPLKKKLRELGVELISDIRLLAITSSIGKHFSMTEVVYKISEILSFIEISVSIGFISEMNYSILKKEFNLIKETFKDKQDVNLGQSFQHSSFRNDKIKNFAIPKKFLEVDMSLIGQTTFKEEDKGQIKDIKDILNHKGQLSYKDVLNSIKKTPVFNENNNERKEMNRALDIGLKIERKNKIIKLLHEKKEVSIKDVSSAVIGCSEKTIQRELASLVKKGILKKEGDKRWSKYTLV